MDVRLTFESLGEWTFSALVDTGAPITFCDLGAAEALCIRIGRAGARRGTTRILGGLWGIQFETVDLMLVEHPECSWTAEVAFVTDRGLQMPFGGVLGAQGFLDKYAVTFNAYYNYFAIERPDECHDRLAGLVDKVRRR